MKNKPQKHKTTNTFRYKSFTEHVGEIDIRRTALYYIGHANEETIEENETYFSQAIRKWSVLNLTTDYHQFSKKCQGIVTLPQLLHKKDFVVNYLLKSLGDVSTLSLQPLLEILVAVAKDLREEFYPYFPVVLQKLISLLDTQDAEQLEWTLVCLAFLFKTLKPFLRRNIDVVLRSVLPILDETKYPEHITHFAVECFAFVARDIKDFEKLLTFIMKEMNEFGEAGIFGMGRLFFEIIRGVEGNFHSIADTFLSFIFDSLMNEMHDRILLYEIMEQMVENILNFIHPHNITLYWNIICRTTVKCLNNDVSNVKVANKFVLLMQKSAEWKDGKYLNELDPLVGTIINLIDATEDKTVLMNVSHLVCQILMSSRAKVAQLDTSRLIKKVLGLPLRQVYEDFILKICMHAQFEILVLPEALKHFEFYLDEQSLNLMVKVIFRKSPMCGAGIKLKQWKQYPLVFKKTESVETFLDIVKSFHVSKIEDKSSVMFLQAVIIIPHVVGINKTNIGRNLVDHIAEICKLLTNKEVSETKQQNYLFYLQILSENVIHLKEDVDKSFYHDILETVLSLCGDPKCLIALKILDFMASAATVRCPSVLSLDTFYKIHQQLSENLSSSSNEMRLISSHALSCFSQNKQNDFVAVPIYDIFFNCESITPSIHTYRDQLLYLQRISVESELFKKILASKELKTDCLRFLLGLLYHNFKLLWEPTLKIIEGYAAEYDVTTFWDIFKIKLTETADIINGEQRDMINFCPEIDFKDACLKEFFVNLAQISNKVDFAHYRNLLWGCLPNLGKVSEVKNREIVSIFLKFVQEEYKKAQQNSSLTWNILVNDDSYDQKMEDDEIEENAEMKTRHPISKSNKSNVSTLIVKLGTFTKLVNPKQIHREKELYQFYLELLSSTNLFLQKLALDCIMAYKNKSLMPYRDQLYSFVDEKKFKDSLINFKIDKDTKNIQPEHRQELLEILLRILYGNMISKKSNKVMSSQIRKSHVMRFLAGCDKTEILLFLKMAFGIYEEVLNRKLDEIPDEVTRSLSLEKVWSPKKLQSTINTLEMIRKQFGGLMEEDFLEYLLKIVVFVGSVCETVLMQAEKINPKIVAIFKNLKSTCLLNMVNFFDHFQNFKWNEKQISPIFKVFVWPQLSKLSQDSIHSPTPLLKLFHVWTQNPQHFSLLSLEHPFIPTLSPISSSIDLLLNQKSKPIIRSTVMEMIERLLLAPEAIENECNLSAVSGVSVVRPHILKILEKLQSTLKVRGTRRGLDKRELNILSQVTNLVDDPKTCETLLQLLLPILVAKCQTSSGEETVIQVIQTISNLLKRIGEPVKYFRNIAPLFEQITEVSARKELCTLLTKIAKISQNEHPKLLETAKIVSQLNAWDRRWVEQPDYDVRLNAIATLKNRLDDGDVDIDLGLLVIYNCFYFVKYDKDMGLRDNASEFLRILVPKLVEHYKGSKKEIDFLIGDIVLDLIRRTIRDKNDNVRNEGIQLFGELIRESTEAHKILQDLALLTDKSDREVDFFDNITHLQSHRHGRALLKFCSVGKSVTKVPTPQTLTQFILPLATRYLLNEKFASKHTLIDAAIETIRVVCQLLPWHQYLAILKFYLQRMKYNHEYQKQLVRIVVAILDAFHFDLSINEIDSQEINKNQIETTKVDQEQQIIKENSKNGSTIEQKEEEEEEVKLEDGDLDSELDVLDNSPIDENEIDNETKFLYLEPVYNRITKLSPSNAKTVVHVISTILIPTLNHSITSITSYDTKHKLNRRKRDMEREEEEILRVPIALALVKLLQKLPSEMLETSLPGVFMKVCTFLKSPLKSVRMCTRDILKKVMLCLGTGYLSLLVDKLTALLTRGFQVHVLSVTIHGVLDCLKEQFKPGDLESCLQNILEVTLNDIFGDVAAEKEVEKIGVHTPEAKPSAKSYLTLHIVARNIQESCLVDLLMPFKEHLAKSQSRKTISKIQDCFQRIVSGLVENKNISPETLLIFIYGILSESITELLPGRERPVLTETEKERMRRARPDCFIIPEQPRFRSGAVRKIVKTNTQANAHVLIELGLELLNIVLKRKKIIELDYEPFLNPLVPLLRDSLKSSHIRVTTYALKCLTAIWIGAYELQAIVDTMNEFVEQIFLILHKYTSFDITKKDDNFQLVKSAFKAIVAVIRKCEYHTINHEYVAQLILYIEQDMHEFDKQPMAFSLLKALVNRKVICPEIHDIMKKLCDLSIISESNFAREESRNILIVYLMEYPLQKKVDSIMQFFTTQLNFSVPTGRLSAIEFLHMIVKKFPEQILMKKSEMLFLSLGTRMVNEEVPECRVATAECIEELLSRLNDEQKQKLFDINLLFFDGDKPAVREMAAILCSRFIVQEKENFRHKAKIVLPVLVHKLFLNNPRAPGRFVKAFLDNQHEETNYDRAEELDDETKELREQQKQRALDHELIQIQNCILKIIENCPVTLEDESFDDTINELAYESQRLLGYEHDWVRLNAVKILEKILSKCDHDLISRILLEEQKPNEVKRDFIYLNPETDIKSLTLDLCAQMIPGATNEAMAEQVVKVLLYIANMLKSVQSEFEDKDDEDVRPKINLRWLLRRIRYIVHGEVAKASDSCILRTAIFNWIEGLIELLDTVTLEKLSYPLLSVLIREMSEEDQNIDPKLRQQAIRLGNKIRKRIGEDSYNKLRTSIQTKFMIKRAERRKHLAQEKINDPVRAAKRKYGQQERKKVAKRRKIDVIRGKVVGKKRKRKLEDDDLLC